MPDLLNLSPELIILIFCNLGDFDDVNHLSRCCRALHSVTQNEATYLIVMRTIIGHSDVYKNDIALCKLIETNQAFSSVYQTHAVRPPESGIKVSNFSRLVDEWPDDLTDERVYTIICRWQGLRVLQRLYLDATIGTKYSESTLLCIRTFDPTDIILMTARSVRISHLQNFSAGDNVGKRFDAHQTQRFYRALTSYWLAMESHWLLCRSRLDTWEELWKLDDWNYDIWWGQNRSGLLESLEVIEVYDFVYDYLLRMIFPDVEATLPWLEGAGSVFFENGIFGASNWGHFVHCCRVCLRPPDIIELLAAACSPPETNWPSNKSKYLQQRGAFDLSEGRTEGTALTSPPDGDELNFWYDVTSLEEIVSLQIQACVPYLEHQLFEACWRNFRDEWKLEARWKVFWWTDSNDEILARLQH